LNIKFLKIKLHNFFSFDDAELDLADMGYTLVEGRNYCKLDNAYSNGSGKSSIFNGICFALTGETAQGVSSGIENIFADPDDCWVELSFLADGNSFVIRRYKTPWPRMTIIVNGEDKSGKGIRESSKLLASYLPDLTPTLLNSIIILGQGLPSRFTNNNPAQRKEILEKLTKSDFMIQSIKDKLESRQTELKTILREKEDSLLSTNSQIGVYDLQLKKYKLDLEQYKLDDNSEDGIASKIESIKENLQSITIKLDSFTAELEKYNNDIKESTNEYNSLVTNSNNELAEKLKPFENDISKNTKETNELYAEIKSLTKEIKKLDSITDTCPTCGQKIPNVNKPDTTNKKKELDKLNEEYKSLCNEGKQLSANLEQIKKDHNSSIAKKLSDLNSIISSKRESFDRLNNEKDSLIKQKVIGSEQLAKYENFLLNYNKLIENINSTEEIVGNLTKVVNSTTADIADINNHLGVIQQMLTLAKREFRGVLLLNFIEYINKKVKQYAQIVFSTDQLDFILDENAIDINYLGKPYENLSGGEKQKIDVIVQLALRDILSKQLNVHSNLICLDEIFDNMDAIGCSKIMSLISALTDIESVFIISHHAQDLELTKDNSIIVEKNESGISSIKIV